MKTLAFALFLFPLVSTAFADDEPKSPELPKDGCIWASKVFSNGASFCWIDGSVQTCEAGAWKIKDNSHCKSMAPIKPD